MGSSQVYDPQEAEFYTQHKQLAGEVPQFTNVPGAPGFQAPSSLKPSLTTEDDLTTSPLNSLKDILSRKNQLGAQMLKEKTESLSNVMSQVTAVEERLLKLSQIQASGFVSPELQQQLQFTTSQLQLLRQSAEAKASVSAAQVDAKYAAQLADLDTQEKLLDFQLKQGEKGGSGPAKFLQTVDPEFLQLYAVAAGISQDGNLTPEQVDKLGRQFGGEKATYDETAYKMVREWQSGALPDVSSVDPNDKNKLRALLRIKAASSANPEITQQGLQLTGEVIGFADAVAKYVVEGRGTEDAEFEQRLIEAGLPSESLKGWRDMAVRITTQAETDSLRKSIYEEAFQQASNIKAVEFAKDASYFTLPETNPEKPFADELLQKAQAQFEQGSVSYIDAMYEIAKQEATLENVDQYRAVINDMVSQYTQRVNSKFGAFGIGVDPVGVQNQANKLGAEVYARVNSQRFRMGLRNTYDTYYGEGQGQ